MTLETTGDTSSKMDDSEPINWRLHPRIQKDIQQLNSAKNNPDSPFGSAGPMAVSKGQEITLKLTVVDPELAQVVLSRAFAGNECGRVPGMVIQEVSTNPERQRIETLVQQLRDLADDLELASHNKPI